MQEDYSERILATVLLLGLIVGFLIWQFFFFSYGHHNLQKQRKNIGSWICRMTHDGYEKR